MNLTAADFSEIILNRLFVEADLHQTKQMTEAEIVALEPRLVGADLAPAFASLLHEQKIAHAGFGETHGYTLTVATFEKLLYDYLEGLNASRQARVLLADLFPDQ